MPGVRQHHGVNDIRENCMIVIGVVRLTCADASPGTGPRSSAGREPGTEAACRRYRGASRLPSKDDDHGLIDDTPHPAGVAGDRRAPYLGVQQFLGLRSERTAGVDPGRTSGARAARNVIEPGSCRIRTKTGPARSGFCRAGTISFVRASRKPSVQWVEPLGSEMPHTASPAGCTPSVFAMSASATIPTSRLLRSSTTSRWICSSPMLRAT